ncbi:hypothetical protein QTP88_010387 [Uroleucon formosanum]
MPMSTRAIIGYLYSEVADFTLSATALLIHEIGNFLPILKSAIFCRFHWISSGQKTMVVNLYKDLKSKDPDMPYKQMMSKISETLGIGLNSVRKIISEYKSTGTVASPTKTRNKKCLFDKIDDLDRNALRQKVHSFWLKKELPTIDKILEAVNDDPALPNFKRTTLYTTIKKLDFVFTKRKRCNVLTEREDLLVWRQNYLYDVRKFREEGRAIQGCSGGYAQPRIVDNNGILCGTRNGKLLETRFRTWNIRTLYKAGALKNIVEEIEKYKVPIVAIQEIRWLGNGNVQSSNSTIFFSGKETGKHEQGVGFVVRNSIMSSIKRFMPVNERLCYLQMAGWNFDICIINGYAPTEDQEEEVKNIFYEDLERLFDSLPNNCIKIIAGDLNAQVGKEQFLRPTIGQESWHSVSNDNGLRLVGFAESKNLIISSTYFPRKNIHKHTWTAPDGKTKSQIDHIIIDKRHRTSIKNVRSYRGADGDTDHFLVVASLSLKLSTIWRKKQQPNAAHKLDRSKLRDQKEIMEYQNKIKEGLNSFNIIQGDLSNVIEWTQIKESLIKAAETLRDTKGKVRITGLIMSVETR